MSQPPTRNIGPPGAQDVLGQVHNSDIAAALNQIADMIEIGGGNRFRVRAYRNAAHLIACLGEEVASMIDCRVDLDDLPGIGGDLAGKITDIARTGTTPLLERLRGDVPHGLTRLLHIPGIGPRRIERLYRLLGIGNREQLHRAFRDGRVAELAGFGPNLARRLLHSLEAAPTGRPRMKTALAAQHAEELLAWLRSCPHI